MGLDDPLVFQSLQLLPGVVEEPGMDPLRSGCLVGQHWQAWEELNVLLRPVKLLPQLVAEHLLMLPQHLLDPSGHGVNAWDVFHCVFILFYLPGIDSMPKRVQEVLRKHEEVFSNKLRKELNWPEQDIELLPGLPVLPSQATRAKRIPARFFDHAWKQLQALKHQGIIKPH